MSVWTSPDYRRPPNPPVWPTLLIAGVLLVITLALVYMERT